MRSGIGHEKTPSIKGTGLNTQLRGTTLVECRSREHPTSSGTGPSSDPIPGSQITVESPAPPTCIRVRSATPGSIRHQRWHRASTCRRLSKPRFDAYSFRSSSDAVFRCPTLQPSRRPGRCQYLRGLGCGQGFSGRAWGVMRRAQGPGERHRSLPYRTGWQGRSPRGSPCPDQAGSFRDRGWFMMHQHLSCKTLTRTLAGAADPNSPRTALARVSIRRVRVDSNEDHRLPPALLASISGMSFHQAILSD